MQGENGVRNQFRSGENKGRDPQAACVEAK